MNEKSEEKIFLPEYKEDVNYIISNASEPENDVVEMDFPEYSEDFPHIIGEDAYEKEESFVSNKAEIYNRNMLKADEDDFVHKEHVRKEQERLEEEVRQLEDDIKFAGFMKKFKTVMLAAAAVAVSVFVIAVLNFTSEDEEEISETAAVMTEAFTTVTSEKASVKSSAAVSETEITTEKTVPPEKMPLVPTENQYSYSDKRVSVLMEYDSVKCSGNYPYLCKNGYEPDWYVLKVNYTVKNISDRNFDLITESLDLFLNDSGYCSASYFKDIDTAKETEMCIPLESGETAEFSVYYFNEASELKKIGGLDFWEKGDVYTCDITQKVNTYYAEDIRIDAPLPQEYIDYLDRQMTTASADKVNMPLVPEDDEYSVDTEYMSYCFRLTELENYIQMDMRVQNLTAYSRVLDPFFVRLYRGDDGTVAHTMSFAPGLCTRRGDDPKVDTAIPDAVGVTEFYDRPWDIVIAENAYVECTFFYVKEYDFKNMNEYTSIKYIDTREERAYPPYYDDYYADDFTINIR